MINRKNINTAYYKAEPDKDATATNCAMIQKTGVRNFRTPQIEVVCKDFLPTSQPKAVKW
jgi:hypothetical protein